MNILYDLWASQPLQGRHHGGGTHALAVLEGLVTVRRDHELSVFYDRSKWLDPTARALLNDRGIRLIDVRDRAGLQSLLQLEHFDCLYSSLPYDLYDLDMRSVDFVLTIHGLRQLEMPADKFEFVYADGWHRRFKSLMRRAGLPVYRRRQSNRLRRLMLSNARSTSIIVPSTHTKHALLNTFPTLSPDHITVAYSPLPEDVGSNDSAEDRGKVLRNFEVTPRGYFLLVNGGRWIKNAYRALRALDQFFTARPEAIEKVVCLGVEEGQRLTHHLRNHDRFVFRDYVPRATLQTLYREAFSLIYPTLNEGFGYPPLEAMRWGTPVICSAVTSLPEVCDSAALYCNPFQIGEIQNRISQLVLEPGLWDRYSERGRVRHGEVEILQRDGLRRICDLILGRE